MQQVFLQVTGHVCRSSPGEQNGLVCKQSRFGLYLSHQSKIHYNNKKQKKLTFNECSLHLITGCKENHFHGLPFGQGEAKDFLAQTSF